MNDLEKHIHRFIKSKNSSHYFIACSGGVDSMVLLNVFYKMGLNVSALHVNYQLRGEDSEKDQQLIEEFCRENNITCHVKRIELQKYLDLKGGNLQEEARTVRYSFFESFKTNSDVKIVLGHHADDQVETFFLNLARGSGMMGLACMLPDHNDYMRPLLPLAKNEIIAYAKSNKVKWREDVSNASNKYSRNKLRNVILPELKDAIPTLQESILFLTQIFQENQKEIELHIFPFAQSVRLIQEISFEQFDELNTYEIMELLRQLNIPLSMHSEFLKLRNADKGKRIELIHENYSEVVHENNCFHFKSKESNQFIPELKIEKIDKLPSEFSKDIVYLDPSTIKGKLQIRKWKIGDRMRPIGLKGSKLISDILTDAKVPNHLRENKFVVEDEEKIVWCAGYAVGEISKAINANNPNGILKLSLILPDEHPVSTSI